MIERETKPTKTIARRMAVGFGLVSVVAVLMCGLLVTLINQVSGHVDAMRKDEAAIKESLALATSIREQYIHQAHWLIERKDTHLAHYEEWLGRVDKGLAALSPLMPEHQETLDSVSQGSAELDRLFWKEVVPAAKDGDAQRVAELHHKADLVAQGATAKADALARAVEARMAGAHRSATKATTLGLFSGLVCVFCVVALSVMFTIRLRRSVLTPLKLLSEAARRFGSGDFQSRVGTIGEGELLAVSGAFDTMAAELEKRESKLVAAERMAAIGQLAAGIAHEINNPIAVIRGYLKTMTPDSPPETLQEELQILDEEAAACQRIAEDLVAYSRSQNLEYEAIEMNAFVGEAVRRFGETPEGRQHEIDLYVEPASMRVDPTRLRQVLLNLLINAAQVSKAGTPIVVEGKCDPGGGYSLCVTDRGPGIPAEDRERIFEPFFSKRSGGSGLGLAVSQGIVRAHGGSITVHKAPLGGAKFLIRLPGAPKRTNT